MRRQLVDRYFAVQPQHINQFRAAIVPDHDVLPLDISINAAPIKTLLDGRILVHMRLNERHLAAMQQLADIFDPLSQEAVKTLDLLATYIGATTEEVLARLPELSGTDTHTDPETHQTYEVPRFTPHTWM